MRATRVIALACAGLLACAESGDADDDGSTSTGAASWPPPVCELERSPFLDADCLAALRDGCNAAQTEAACAGVADVSFDGYGIECAWAEIITIDDVDACIEGARSGRCEARIVQECPTECTAIPSADEIVVLCGGPLGPSSAVDAADSESSSCGQSPPAGSLCACAPASCNP